MHLLVSQESKKQGAPCHPQSKDTKLVVLDPPNLILSSPLPSLPKHTDTMGIESLVKVNKRRQHLLCYPLQNARQSGDSGLATPKANRPSMLFFVPWEATLHFRARFATNPEQAAEDRWQRLSAASQLLGSPFLSKKPRPSCHALCSIPL